MTSSLLLFNAIAYIKPTDVKGGGKKVLLEDSRFSSRVSKDEAHTPAVDPGVWQSSAPYDMKTHIRRCHGDLKAEICPTENHTSF